MSKQTFDAQLQQQLSNLNKDKLPEKDLWQGIELAMAEQEQPDSESVFGQRVVKAPYYAIAASIAIFGFVGWLSLGQLSTNKLSGDDLVALLSEQHQEQKSQLLVALQDQPALTQNWQEQLDELDEAAVAIKKALENEPNNIALLKMLKTVHQQQINLIERVHAPKWSQI